MEGLEIRLPSAVTDTTMEKINDLRVNVYKAGNGSGLGVLYVGTVSPVTLSFVYGKGLFTDSSGTSIGATLVVNASAAQNVYFKVSADDVINIDNKYAVNIWGALVDTLPFYRRLDSANSPVVSDFDIQYLKYSKVLTRLNLGSGLAKGFDISELANLSTLTALMVRGNGNITGSLAVVANFLHLEGIDIRETGITGDISALAGISTLKFANLNSLVSGNTSSISGQLPQLTNITFLNAPVTGNLSHFSNFPILNLIAIGGSGVAGDINSLPASVTYIEMRGSTTGITYTGGQGVKFTAFQFLNIPACAMTSSQIDNLLIMLSKATFSGSKMIGLKGSRTSASDSAVATLVSMGVTININS